MAKERQADSVTHHEERHARMQQEAADQQKTEADAVYHRELAQSEREHKIREKENQELTQQAGIVKEGETREMLLQRIRDMRERDTPKEVDDTPGYRSEGMQKQFDAEQEVGRKAVAAAEAEHERYREIWQQQEAEEKKRRNDAEMNPVYHPNPSQDEQYPAEKATLGKRK